jgi:hypothetical protein
MARYNRNISPAAMLALVAIVIAAVVLVPFAIIWALNTLFVLSIPYDFWTWLAVLVLTSSFGKPNIKIGKD